jgi:hypothetical protein
VPRVFSKPRFAACLLVVFALGVLGSALVIGAVLVYAKPLVEYLVTTRAERHGVTLKFQDLDFGWGWVTFDRAEFRLLGVQGIQGKAERVTVHLQGFTPVQATGQGVRLDAEGALVTLVLELSRWIQRYTLALRFQLEARDMQAVWRERPGVPPWLSMSQGELLPTATGVRLRAAQAVVAGARLGGFSAGWDVNDSYLDLGLGDPVATRAPIRLVVYHAVLRPTVDLTLRPLPLDRLAQPFGLALPVKNVSLSGAARLAFPPRAESGAIEGVTSIKLVGWVPPHPPELDGFVFGNETSFDTRLSIAPDYQTVTLTQSRVKAGAFVLRGGGSIHRYDHYARTLLDLRGELPCASLANAMAESTLGRVLGPLLGRAAELAVKGSVAVLVQVDADTRNLAGAKVVRTLGIGCGLHPVSIPGVGQIDLSKLPPLPKLQDFPWPDFEPPAVP